VTGPAGLLDLYFSIVGNTHFGDECAKHRRMESSRSGGIKRVEV
jgi:hypothetical protein